MSNLIHTEELSTEEDVPETREENAPQTTLRVLIADDHDLVREALSQRIEREPDMVVTAVAKDGHEIGELVRKHPFDVVLLDIEMPGPSVFEVVEEVVRTRPTTAVLLVSGFVRAHDLERAIKIGVHGFVAKAEPLNVLLDAIRRVARGATFFSETVDRRIAERLEGGSSLIGGLTPREVEVMAHVTQGHTKRETAQMLSISVKTVESHVQNLMKKLAVHNNVELTRFAIREGFVQP